MHLAIEHLTDQRPYEKTGFTRKFAYLDHAGDDDYAHHWAHRVEAGRVDGIPYAIYRAGMECFVDDPNEIQAKKTKADTTEDDGPWGVFGFFLFKRELFEVIGPTDGEIDFSSYLKGTILSRSGAVKRRQPIWDLSGGKLIPVDGESFLAAKGKWKKIVGAMNGPVMHRERSGTYKGLEFAVYRVESDFEDQAPTWVSAIKYDEKVFRLGLDYELVWHATDNPPVFVTPGKDAERLIDASKLNSKNAATMKAPSAGSRLSGGRVARTSRKR